MDKWYLVCYLGSGNAISVKSRHNNLDAAEQAMKAYTMICFIMEVWA